MPAPATTSDFLDVVRKSRLVDESELKKFRLAHPNLSDDPNEIAAAMCSAELLTKFQSEQLLRGKYRGFVLGKFKLLDRIGLGGMGQVFLATHGVMRKQVALKVLPPDRAKNQFARERFVREARTTGQLEHPNLIKAYDLDSDGDVNFLVLEYVDGISLQDLVTRNGPLDSHRTAYYLWQAASGLAYLSRKGLVHRDIKPANLIVDRVGAVKILDLGLVREEEGGDDLTKREDVKFLGTADYLAPEQLASCSTVDVRADLYALGATGYFLLTGKVPYGGGSIAEKLLAAQSSEARAAHLVNPAVPLELSVIITKLMAKKISDRYQTPEEVLEVLDPWAETPPDPPPEKDFPNRDGSQSTPLPNSAVALSFNMMKAARGGSGASTSSQKLSNQASISSQRLNNIITPAPASVNKSGKSSQASLDTPSPVAQSMPTPVQTPAPPKSVFAPIKQPTSPKKSTRAHPSALPPVLSAAEAAPPVSATPAGEPSLVDFEKIRKITDAPTVTEPVTPGLFARCMDFLKSIFSRKKPESNTTTTDE
ncbi:MAG: protein kinase [Gemmataceae bacterium]